MNRARQIYLMDDGGDRAALSEAWECEKDEGLRASKVLTRWRARNGCNTCHTILVDGWGPNHEPSSRCQSGKRAHCTCDTCW